MIGRRQLFGGALLAGLGEGGQAPDRASQDMAEALKDIRKSIDQWLPPYAEIKDIRQKQIDYLRSAGKFPDFIDVGTTVWFGVHDWHVRHLQPMTLGRDVNGRYTIQLLATSLVMHPDMVPTGIGNPYDNK